jgi:hypothetical protein
MASAGAWRRKRCVSRACRCPAPLHAGRAYLQAAKSADLHAARAETAAARDRAAQLADELSAARDALYELKASLECLNWKTESDGAGGAW